MITFALVAYNNIDGVHHKVNEIIIPTMRHMACDYEIICADNSPVKSELYLPGKYVWMGQNTYYAGGLNHILSLARYEYIVYLCATHGTMYDVTWIDDLIAPLQNEKVAMAGRVWPMNMDPIGVHHTLNHVQGGIFAAKTKILRENPYSPDYLHIFSDAWICWKLQDLGYELANVTSIMSVYQWLVPDWEITQNKYKYVHDEKNTPRNAN